MKHTEGKRWLSIFLVALPLMLANVLFCQAHDRGTQEKLDRDLFVAIRAKDGAKALASLAAGADANAKEGPDDIRPIWQRLRDSAKGKSKPATFGDQTPLLVLLQVIRSENSGIMSAEPDFVYKLRPGNPDLVKALLDKGARLNVHDENGDTPLLLATKARYHQTIMFLLDKGANPNDVDKSKLSSLHYAAKDGDTAAI